MRERMSNCCPAIADASAVSPACTPTLGSHEWLRHRMVASTGDAGAL